MIPLSKVIAELDPNADVTCSGNNIDNIIWHKGTPIAKDIIEAKQNELQAKYDAEEIRRYYNKVKSYKKTMKKFNIPSKGSLWDVLNRVNIY